MTSHSLLRRLLPGLLTLALFAAASQGTAATATNSSGNMSFLPAPSGPAPLVCTPSSGGSPNGAACGGAGPASLGNLSGTDHGAGNPLDVLTGNKYQRETDLPALPGVLGLEIVRHYNSALAHTDSALGWLGRGWRLSYETDLYAFEHHLEIVQADGTRLVFARERSAPGRAASLDPAHGTLAIARSGRTETYQWRWPDGRTLDFDARGKLVQIQAPTGEFVSLTRGPRGELMKVTDPQGRSLSFEYAPRNATGFRGIVAITSPLGRFTYEHQNDRARPGLSNLVAVTAPDGLRHHYHYGADPQESAPAWPHHLTGISVAPIAGDKTDPDRAPADTPPGPVRLATYGYDSAGRAILSVRGTPRRDDEAGRAVPGTGIEQVELGFPDVNTTVLTNSVGARTTYRHTLVAGARRLLEARGPGCARCGATDVRYRYDAAARLVETTRLDAAGRPIATARHERDARGRILRTRAHTYAEGRALAPRLVARYEYANDSPRPVLAARPSVVPGREHRIALKYNESGQITSITESGFSPLEEHGEPATSPDRATPISRTTTYAYTTINGRSLLAEIDGPLPNGPSAAPSDSDITRIEWDRLGNFITALEQPGGRRNELQHLPDTGWLQRVTDAEGFATAYTYDTLGQVANVRSHSPGGANAHEQQIRYDAFRRPIEGLNGSEPAANWRQAWDEHDRLIWRASALGVLGTYAYDTESRPTEYSRQSASFVQSQSRSYDANGRLEHVLDNAGRSLQWYYDEGGQVERTVDALGFEYAPPRASPARPNEADRPGPARTLSDDFGRVVWRHSPDSGAERRQFDAADRLGAMQDARGNRARYEYDAQGRILRQTITDAASGAEETTRWIYAGQRLVELVHPTQSERYEYDGRGQRSARIVRIPTERGELTAVTRYEHDEAGRLVATTLPDGSRLQYVRNGQGQVVALRRGIVHTSWLRALAGEHTIAQDFERDLAGLRAYTAGNGIQTLHQRSRAGVLARVVHRHRPLERARLARHGSGPLQLAGGPQQVAERLLGIAPAHAQPRSDTPNGASAAFNTPARASTDPSTPPGALDLPTDPAALLDHRYVWDARGNLLHSRQLAAGAGALPAWNSHAYDRDSRLLASVEWSAQGGTLAERAVWRYAYDAAQRRVLSQQDVPSQAELRAATQRSIYAPGSHRRIDADGVPVHYSASGQPEHWGSRDYDWDARGRLVAVREHGATVARYRYDHRGLRHAKEANGQTRYTLYDEARQPLAELDGEGRILRQYIWLADLPLAVLDTPEDTALAPATQSAAARITGDLLRIVKSWLAGPDGLAWLHSNHLGAPELVTGTQGQVLWRAHYAPFGAARVQADAFVLDLRLPGQHFDAETGLHYNRARYYDPQAGQYLSPDPLGTPDGPNPYAYVAFNPLRFIDPDGLILFAFDGTENTDDVNWLAANNSSISNVVRFREAYNDGKRHYVTGVGTVHPDSEENGGPINPPALDAGVNWTGVARIDRMMLYLEQEAIGRTDDEAMQIDIIGFSRGAAQARDFANQIAANSFVQGGRTFYRYTNRSTNQQECQWVNFRFMGLWDTVLSTNSGRDYQLGIPAQFTYVAHAVALNEYRSQPDATWDVLSNRNFYDRTRTHLPGSRHWGGFPLQSIGASSSQPGQVRIERGFIGAHADIGGGYAANENGLSTVALSWMVGQAQIAGVNMDMSRVPEIASSDPFVHDQSNVIRFGDPRQAPANFQVCGFTNCLLGSVAYNTEDREVRGGQGDGTQRTQTFGPAEPGGNRSMTNADTHPFITYMPRPDNIQADTRNSNDIAQIRDLSNRTGTVDIQSYMSWLRQHGYVFAGEY